MSGIFFGGGYFRCFRRAGGTVECSGINDLGQLGDGTIGYATGVNTFRATFAPVIGLTDAVQISVGTGNHACARRATGNVVCWGGGSYGALGNGSSDLANRRPPWSASRMRSISASVCSAHAPFAQAVRWFAGATTTEVPRTVFPWTSPG